MVLNPFNLFNLEPTLDLKEEALDSAYFEMQSKYHPDRFPQQSAIEKESLLRQAAEINYAYQLLKNPLSRTRCLLELKGAPFPKDEEPLTTPETLAEAFELREVLADAQTSSALQVAVQTLDKRIKDCFKEMRAVIETGQIEKSIVPYVRLIYLYKSLEELKDRQRHDTSLSLVEASRK